MSFNWNSIKSVILHAGILFLSAFSASMAATGWTVQKAAVVAAISAGAASAVAYLTGLLPNATVSSNRVTARIRSIASNNDQAA